jgi:predicted RNA-binding Zn-ribbon protein involved in translation (DUF1610 family)
MQNKNTEENMGKVVEINAINGRFVTKPKKMITYKEQLGGYTFIHYDCPKCGELCTIGLEMALESELTEKMGECESCGYIYLMKLNEI